MNSNNTEFLEKMTIEDMQKMVAAYKQMYRGMTNMRRTQNVTLGQAMYQASGQMKEFVESKKTKTVATRYLHQVHAEYSAVLARQMMTAENRDEKLNLSDDKRGAYIQRATRDTQTGMTDINSVLAQYKESENARKTEKPIIEKPVQKDAKPVIKTARENREKMPNGVAAKDTAHRGPQMPASKLADKKQLPMQNMHNRHDYGVVAPRRAFQIGSEQIKAKGRDFENIKKLQMALIRQQFYNRQNAA